MTSDFRKRFIQHWKGHNPEIQLEFLDSIDFEPFLADYDNVKDIMNEIQDIYDYGYKRDKIPSELHNCIFNLMDEYDFGCYLEDRYPDYELTERNIVWYEMRKR